MPDAEAPAVPAWMGSLSQDELARIELGRLLLKYGNELRGLIVDDEAYELIGKLAGMLDKVNAQ